MKRLTVLLTAVAVVCLLAGCSETPHEAGIKMAEKHIKVGMNPSSAQKSRMQAEFNRKAADYSLAQKQEFMKGYMETVMTEVQTRMSVRMGQAMNHAGRQLSPPR